jgi:formate C-acetyltransferase
MSEVKLPFIPKFEQSERIKVLEARNQELSISKKRQFDAYGDHRCWLNVGPFPHMDKLPSQIEGYRMDCEQWGKDFECMLDYTEPHIYPCETIVGEIYWEIGCIRPCNFDVAPNAEEIREKNHISNEMGGFPTAYGHTCPDMEIVLNEGYDKILEKIRYYKDLYTQHKNEKRANFLRGLEHVCLGCIHYIERYADLAEKLAREEKDTDEQKRFLKIAKCCRNIAHQAPSSFYEAVQALQFSILFDRSVGHGNGYGRMDQYMMPFYQKDKEQGNITRTEAREYIAEMYMKLRGQFFSFAGRLADGSDATNEMSWIALEAYDLVGDYNNLGVMWHSDIDKDYYDYACDVLARHGESIPIMVNWDNMYAAEIRSGIPVEDAKKVVFCGCQWFCIPGKEWCGHDTSYINTMTVFERALHRAGRLENIDFEAFYAIYEEELHATMKAYQDAEAANDRVRGDCKPEMYTSMISHGPIERGLDMTAPRGVDYQYSALNICGLPNVADSFTAIKKLVFEKKQYTLAEVLTACQEDWAGKEVMRQKFLNQPKYGNGLTEPDAMFVRVCDSMLNIAESYYNQRGAQPMRPSLYSFMTHVEAKDTVGASPDGRHKGEVLAHGINPQLGASKKGLISMANSASSVDMKKFQGGSIQVDIQPRFFDGKENRYEYIRDFTTAFFMGGGQQINLHIMDLKKLEDAIEHPENPEYRNLTVRVTGYCARFITLSREYQENFVARMNYSSMN